MQSLLNKASQVKMLVLDVDGILSDGQIIYNDKTTETKNFDVQDGYGIQRLHDAGIKTAIITGRSSEIVAYRGKELKITHVIQGREDKLVALNELLADIGLTLQDCAYMGDDWSDIKALQSVGFAATVPNAHGEVIKRVDMVTTRHGGHGAVREVCDIILKATGHYDNLLAKYVLA